MEPALDRVGTRREFRIAGIKVSGSRRRPTGVPPPLPRVWRGSGVFWAVTGAAVVLIWVSLFAFPATTNWWTDIDLAVLERMVRFRSDALTDVAEALHALGSALLIRPVRWTVVLVLAYYKRFRALFAALGSFLVVAEVSRLLADSVARPRPLVDIIGDWVGYAHPSRPVAALAVTLAVVGLTLIPAGRGRRRFFVAAAAIVSLLGLARMYLGVDHPSDVWTSAFLGPSVAVVIFRLWVPEQVFPVTYSKGVTAHLDVTGARGAAIETALQEQLGLTALEIEPFGLAGSGGSTPLRIRVEGDPEQYVFAKLYASSHLRADRWYKAGRTLLYGPLEDEVRFQSVRRLVEYEDYILLLLSRAGLPSPEPLGFVEITPEREYLIVTEFIEGACELGDCEVTEGIIDDALRCVRLMWNAGLAHRDIKPANVLVKDDDHIVLIDPAFATVRPSPWRQAVDLANMMIILGLRADPELVYERALQFFDPDDIAEAFAAAQGVTIPSQSRSKLAAHRRSNGIDLIEAFRSLAPEREPIRLQRWNLRRVGLALGALFSAMILLSLAIDNVSGAGFM
jgi:membrane-associated phospholipid phosphatase